MRIGEFSEKHNITHDTIRHYIDMGLLIPRKDGYHYRFDNTHDEDIKRIIELKELDFSLLEIQRILNFNRLAGKTSKEYRNYYIDILEDKKKHVLKCQKRYEEIETVLDEKIEKIKNKGKKPKKILGIKIDALEILHCPICKSSLNISDGSIENNMIIKGKILCSCGYDAYIKEGIYTGASCEKNNLSKKAIPSKLDFLEYLSTEFINFYYDGMSEIMAQIKENAKKPKYVLELENCSGTFLMQHIEQLKEDTTYILVNNDKSRLEKLKESLELNNAHDNFIFICEDFNNLPIKTKSIDIIIDHWMTKDYAFEKKSFLLDELTGLLKDQGLLIGTYPYLVDIYTGLYMEELKEKGYFNSQFLSKKFKDLGFEEKSIKTIGPIVDKKPYNQDIKDKKLYSNIYTCVKD